MALLASPAVVSIGLIINLFIEFAFAFFASYASTPYEFIKNFQIFLIIPLIIIPLLLLFGIWFFYIKKTDLPEKASELFLPVFIAFCYYMGVWILIFGFSKYNIHGEPFSFLHIVLTIPYFVLNLIIYLLGDIRFFPVLYAASTIFIVLAITINCKIQKEKIRFDKKTALYVLIMIGLCGIAAFQLYDRSKKTLFANHGTEQIQDEVNFYDYHPFFEYNILKKINDPVTISFTDNYPKLDGATAAYPVYAAMVQEIYKGLDAHTVRDYVRCSNTDIAYGRLFEGEIDIFFGAQPSRHQIETAQLAGVEFALTPIAREAFVFFVNKENPVRSLTLEQIQNIYTKNITNWRDVGGKRERIMPFQQPENSGSQTIMLAMVMGDKALPPPLREEYAGGMGGIINRVAAYRNYSSAIGYSFRYFATGMKPNDNIKLLAVGGIEPTVENIRNGTYPFTIDVYAVTAGSTNGNTEKLIQWILSEQGQGFIEQCGYVRR